MIPALSRDRSSDKSKGISKKYADQYDQPKRTSNYHDIPEYEISLPPSIEPVSFIATPTISDLSLPSSVLYADSISLYGVDPTSKQPLGLPIADAYLASHHGSSFTYLGIADGCGWGNGPCRAAQCAVRSVRSFLMQKLTPDRKYTARDVAHYLLSALTRANEHVLQSGSDPQDPLSAGTTTVLCGLAVRLVNAAARDLPPYVFIGISLGDCKAYRISRRLQLVRDLSKGGPRGDNATDPGGRLGPANYKQPTVPDLRNLQLLFAFLEPGDALLLMSDGVHDNLDPVFLGEWDEKTPKGKPWKLKHLEAKKEEKAQAVVNAVVEHSSQDIGKAFMRHCTDTVQAVIDFMATNKGGGRLKQDFRSLPGKQDHATILVYTIPSDATPDTVSSPTSSPLSSPRISPSTSRTNTNEHISGSRNNMQEHLFGPSSSPPRERRRIISPHISPSRIKIGTRSEADKSTTTQSASSPPP